MFPSRPRKEASGCGPEAGFREDDGEDVLDDVVGVGVSDAMSGRGAQLGREAAVHLADDDGRVSRQKRDERFVGLGAERTGSDGGGSDFDRVHGRGPFVEWSRYERENARGRERGARAGAPLSAHGPVATQ